MSNNTSSALFHLESHPIARSRAVTSSPLSKGTIVLSTLPIATVLLDSEKGRRCDSCLRARADLQRCTACKSYWYCDSTCQMISWKAHHRRLCQRLRLFTSSTTFQSLSSPEKLHSLLLVHLLTEHARSLLPAFVELGTTPSQAQENLSDPITTVLSLLPQPGYKHVVPTVNLEDLEIPDALLTLLSSCFANNNFTIHSARTIVFAHGVFPLASRSFNHSCVPCAVPVYRHTNGSPCITMEIRLLRDLELGEEITIPYTDPALPYFTRKVDLELTYGFTCECFLCREAHLAPAPTTSPSDLARWETDVRDNLLPSILQNDPPSFQLRKEFLRSWHPSYLSPLAEAFSDTSHDGPYKLAIQRGVTLLAVYCAIYPPNFPMIGLHALELAKTCWNAFITGATSSETLQDVETYLTIAERTLRIIFGNVTDDTMLEEEPILEANGLREMLRVEIE